MKQLIGKQKLARRLLALILTVVLLPFAAVTEPRADTLTDQVNIRVTYGQSEAQTLFNSINSKRTQTADPSATVTGAALQALSHDYSLETAAMKRAVEIALMYSHTRPNGSSYTTAYSGIGAENIGAGYTTAAAVLQAWSAGPENANIMDGKYTAVGIGHVIYNGTHYWTAEFGTSANAPGSVAPNDSTTTCTVDIRKAYINTSSISTSIGSSLAMNVGDTRELSGLSMSILVQDHYPANTYCPLADSAVATVGDTTVASVNGTTLTALKAGQTHLNITCGSLNQAVILTVKQPSFDEATIDAIPDQPYNNNYPVQPAVTVRIGNTILRQNTDYTVTYLNNQNMGKAMVTIVGIGRYAGSSKTTTFNIVGPSIANAIVNAIPDVEYTGYDVYPAVTVYLNNTLLRQGIDYNLTYQNNRFIGRGSVTLVGTGTYSGTKIVYFQITGPNIANVTIDAIPDQSYTGNAVQPEVVVRYNGNLLYRNTDYYLSYSNNKNIGTATVTVYGRGQYSGSKTANFRIVGKNIADASVSGLSARRYTGDEIRPSITVMYGTSTLILNKDYTITYKNNIGPGKASIVIHGCGLYSGTKTVTFTIQDTSISSATVKISTQTYDGGEQYPGVTVKLNGSKLYEDIDYTLDYSNNIKPGRAKVVITGQGEYTGKKTAYFVIRPKKATLKSVKRSGRSAVITWKTDSNVTGYEIYRSKKKTSGFSRIATVKNRKTKKYTNKNMARGTYYYKIRSYITINGKKYYSAYSKVKSVKI